jgi:DNA-binding IclR family transcriptional regulator
LLSLTSKLYALGARVGDRVDLISHVRPYLQWLTETTKENAHFCVLRDDHLLLLDQTISMHPVRVVVDTGSLLFPHASAFGKVILAFLPANEQEPLLAHQWPQLTPHTKNDLAELSVELQTIQSCGVAYDLEEYQIGVHCVGAPVFDATGHVVGGMGIMGPSYRLPYEVLSQFAKDVRLAAERVSVTLGAQFRPTEMEANNANRTISHA